MAAAGKEERKRQERIHRKVSVSYDCYGPPKSPGVVGIGKADPVESMRHTLHNRQIRKGLKKNNEAGDLEHISQMMVLEFSSSEANQVDGYPRNPTKLQKHPDASTIRKEALDSGAANHVMQAGHALKRHFSENNDICLQDFVTRPMRTVTKESAEYHTKHSDSKRARARIRALVATDNIDLSLPDNHDLLKEKGAYNPVLNEQFKKVCEPVANPQYFPESELVPLDPKAQKAENKARKLAVSKTNINFQDDGYDISQTFRSSCFMSCHATTPVNSSLDRLPLLSKRTKMHTISHMATCRSAPDLKFPPL